MSDFKVIKALKDCDACSHVLKTGQVIEIHIDIARYLIERGEAELTDETPPRYEGQSGKIIETAADVSAQSRIKR